jgi:hypothetical protein
MRIPATDPTGLAHIVPKPHNRGIDLIRKVCGLAGSLTFLDDLRTDVQEAGILDAVVNRNTPKIFDWLLDTFSYQGISDEVARGYIRKHGSVTWSDMARRLKAAPSCPLLQTYWHFDGCRYDKGSFSCSEPDHIDACPLPRHRLRNGRLNQTAYSFFLFVRDVAKGDLIGWIDDRLTAPAPASISLHMDLARERQEQLIGPLRNVYGVSDKILTMTLSGLLLGLDDRPNWFETGKGMIAIDTLVHNFLYRTGILNDCGAPQRITTSGFKFSVHTQRFDHTASIRRSSDIHASRGGVACVGQADIALGPRSADRDVTPHLK